MPLLMCMGSYAPRRLGPISALISA